MTQEEWIEMKALKDAINYNPASVHPNSMERFTELLVKSLENADDRHPHRRIT